MCKVLLRASTEKELENLSRLGVSFVTQAIEAYHEVVVSDEIEEIEWLISK